MDFEGQRPTAVATVSLGFDESRLSPSPPGGCTEILTIFRAPNGPLVASAFSSLSVEAVFGEAEENRQDD